MSIDTYLKNISKRERILLYLMAVMLIFFAVFYLFAPKVTATLENLRKKEKKVQLQYLSLRDKAKKTTWEYTLMHVKKEIDAKKKVIKNINNAQKYIDAYKDNTSWMHMFNAMVQVVKKQKLVLEYIEKKEEKDKKYLFAMSLRGSYKDLLSVLHTLEVQNNSLFVQKMVFSASRLTLELAQREK